MSGRAGKAAGPLMTGLIGLAHVGTSELVPVHFGGILRLSDPGCDWHTETCHPIDDCRAGLSWYDSERLSSDEDEIEVELPQNVDHPWDGTERL